MPRFLDSSKTSSLKNMFTKSEYLVKILLGNFLILNKIIR